MTWLTRKEWPTKKSPPASIPPPPIQVPQRRRSELSITIRPSQVNEMVLKNERVMIAQSIMESRVRTTDLYFLVFLK
jgi:hypothetical protein